jgi:hypothetical protein
MRPCVKIRILSAAFPTILQPFNTLDFAMMINGASLYLDFILLQMVSILLQQEAMSKRSELARPPVIFSI